MSDSTSRGSRGKPPRPRKPRPDFPLYAHKVGFWAKKVWGKTVYFTKWADDPKGIAALEQWLEQKDDLLAGRKPRAKSDALTVRVLLHQFLSSKRELVESGELSARSFSEYLGTGETIASTFGKTRPVDDLMFVTKYGNAWTRAASLTADGEVVPPIDAVGVAFGKLLRELGLHRPRIGFYTLRHVFQTVGSRTRDEVAVSAIMGHADESMAARYREGIDDDRLRRVAEHVRAWLFAEAPSPGPARENLRISDPCDPCDPGKPRGNGARVARGGRVAKRRAVPPALCRVSRSFSAIKGVSGVAFRPRRLGVRPASVPSSRCCRQVLRCDEYRPSRRSRAPSWPDSVEQSASRRMRSLYSAVNRRRTGFSETAGSGIGFPLPAAGTAGASGVGLGWRRRKRTA